MTSQVVTKKRLLNSMEKAGLITLHIHTGKMVEGCFGPAKAWYIEDTVKPRFEFEGSQYEVMYLSGSFFPYVFLLGETK